MMEEEELLSSYFDAALQTVGVVVVVGEVQALSSQASRALAKSMPRPHEMQRNPFFAPIQSEALRREHGLLARQKAGFRL